MMGKGNQITKDYLENQGKFNQSEKEEDMEIKEVELRMKTLRGEKLNSSYQSLLNILVFILSPVHTMKQMINI